MEIRDELKSIIPPLAADEYRQLEQNIIADGCRDPLVTWSGVLIDGHNRLAICEQHGIEYDTTEKQFENIEAVKVWMIDNQKGRRNLTDGWKWELAQTRKGILEAKGKANQKLSDGRGQKGLSKVDKPIQSHNTREELAADLGWSTGKVAMADKVWRDAKPEVKEQVKTGEVSINQAYASVKKDKRKAKTEQDKRDLAEAQKTITEEKRKSIESVCDLRVCSCAELFASGINPDAVITDPPYPKEFLHCFSELAEGCKTAGVPLVAVMSGQSYLPEVMRRLCKHLRYRWTLAYMTPGGQAVQQWQAKVNTSWKPVFLFGDALEWFGDVAVSKVNDNDKRFHNWGQSESGMADLVERLTIPGQLICDPFLGGGTTAVVSLALGRRFVGCDIDSKSVESTKARVIQ